MRCKTCHYSLANLTERRCPECGTPFDPNDIDTFDWQYEMPRAFQHPPGNRALRFLIVVATGVLIAAAYILLHMWIY